MNVELKVERRPTASLIPYARNPRKNDAAVDRMAAAIREFGFRIPIVARSDGSVVDGHLRLKAAQKLGLETVPVALADELTPAQVKAFRLLANESATWAEWNDDLLRLEFEDLQEAGYDLGLTGFSSAEIDAVFSAVRTEAQGAEDAAEERPEQDARAGGPVSREGDVWIMGRHRLAVGSPDDAGGIQLLLDGSKAALFIARPWPDGVDGSGAVEEFFKASMPACAPDASWYVFAPIDGTQLFSVLQGMKAAGCPERHGIVWIKGDGGERIGPFAARHEIILYTWTGRHHFQNGAGGDTVWEFPAQGDGIPAAVIERMMLNNSTIGDVVFSPCGDAKAVIETAEATLRRACVMEREPGAADAAVRRWQSLSGGEAKLEGEGRTFAEVSAARGA